MDIELKVKHICKCKKCKCRFIYDRDTDIKFSMNDDCDLILECPNCKNYTPLPFFEKSILIKEDSSLITCKVCKKPFKLEKNNKYIVQENKGINGIATGTKKFECFDCPHCGCQNILSVREG